MKTGDKVKFTFGKDQEEKEGIIIRMFPKNIHVAVDFPNHKERVIHRKMHQLKL